MKTGYVLNDPQLPNVYLLYVISMSERTNEAKHARKRD